ncbi:hypothetical protein DFH06DRAFT_1304911 [Mycena polygramma]|nr:hypothetical protein DFH06DRAFT_1304911 [Mycena polygramma]
MEPEFSACALPLYSPSHPSPCYSLDPACDETRLHLSPTRTGTRLLPTGIFTKACGSATVVLLDQDSTARVPSYGRRGSVKGSLILEQDANLVCEVVAKLEGRLGITTTESGAITYKVLKNTYPLWCSSSSSSAFPGTIDFTCNFPASFSHHGNDYPLPPSYIARFPGFPSLFAKCTYSLTISITKDRRLGFLSKTKLIYIPIEYKPQNSPAQGISRTPFFLSAVKLMPEEWHQSSFVMNPRCSSTLSAIQCQAFIPSVKVFGLSDTIPLHVQLSGPLLSLRELILPSSSTPGDDGGHTPLRVYLTRMVSFEYRGKATWRVQRTGQGHFRPLPPTVDFDCDCHYDPACDPCDTCVEVLDWDGEVKCDPTVTVGGFQAAGITVKDFITLEIVPLKGVSSSLLKIQHAIPIRFVTDTFNEPE